MIWIWISFSFQLIHVQCICRQVGIICYIELVWWLKYKENEIVYLTGSPLLRDTKSESCSSPSDDAGVINNSTAGSFSVIFRPGETPISSGITPTSDHDTLSSHRYSTHTASRLSGVHSRPEEGKCTNKTPWISCNFFFFLIYPFSLTQF